MSKFAIADGRRVLTCRMRGVRGVRVRLMIYIVKNQNMEMKGRDGSEEKRESERETQTKRG